MTKVLITGMSGLIGGILRQHLEKVGEYDLAALNRRKLEGVKCHQGDISNLEDIKPAFKDIDVVVHLAANLNQNSWKEQLNDNIIGTYNVYLAAIESGVKRVIFASSGRSSKGDASPRSKARTARSCLFHEDIANRRFLSLLGVAACEVRFSADQRPR